MTAPGGFVAGDILGAADLNALPAGVIGYAEVTANQGSITTVADLTSLTLTWTAVAARRYRTSFYTVVSTATIPTTTADYIGVVIADGSNTIKQEAYAGRPHLVDSLVTLVGSVVETSLSGSVTRKLRARTSGGSGTNVMTLNASATMPAYILVEDIGPA